MMTTNYSTQTYTIPQNHFFASQQPSPASSTLKPSGTLILAAMSHWRAAIEAPILALGLASAKELAILATCAVAAGLYPVLLLLSGGVTIAEAKTVLRRGAGR